MTHYCLIALGANLPSATRTVRDILGHALEMIKAESIDVKSTSKWYNTPAYPQGSGPDYVNAVIKVATSHTPHTLLDRLAQIETSLGRVRTERWGARVCDLDLLTHGETILPDLQTYTQWRDLPQDQQMSRTPQQLILPHPRLQDRAFVLIPLKDVAPDWTHPVSGLTIDQLIKALPQPDIDAVKPIP